MSLRLATGHAGGAGHATRAGGSGYRRRIVLVHGFTQTGNSWARIVSQLSEEFEVVAIDAPNHGGSGATTATNLEEAARLVVEAGGPGCYAGYSMGGRICLQAALDHPEVVQSLVLVSATAGIEDTAERAARRRADDLLATRLETGLDLPSFLAEWLAGPLFAHLSPAQADVESRLANTPPALATSLRTLGTGAMEPLWERLGELTAPVAVVAGEQDEKFTAIGRRLVAGIGATAELHVIAGAGHSVPFERPDDFVRIVKSLARR
jgi:2-succinyl-6-hydroxy-2,4-cyclohexadiene-1-carboxylate synthase